MGKKGNFVKREKLRKTKRRIMISMLTRLEHFVSSKMIVVFLRFFIYLLEIVNLIPNAD